MILNDCVQLAESQATASNNRRIVERAGVLSVLLSGYGGCGKTSLIEMTAGAMDDLRCAAIVAAPEPAPDAARLRHCCPVVAVASTATPRPNDIEHVIRSLDLRQAEL